MKVFVQMGFDEGEDLATLTIHTTAGEVVLDADHASAVFDIKVGAGVAVEGTEHKSAEDPVSPA